MMREEIPEALTTGEFVADGQVPTMENFSKNHTDLEVVITDDMEIAAIQGMYFACTQSFPDCKVARLFSNFKL